MGISYKKAGVNISTAEKAIKKVKSIVKSTFNQNVISDLGLFGGLYDAKFPNYKHPVLVSSTDGVGTKLKIAFLMNKHDTVGQCLVNHCVNDILTTGAKPLFFLDYFATGKLDVETTFQIISGIVTACRENDCVLIGGETAEMPSFYKPGEYDIAGTIVGVVEKDYIIDGSKIQKGDIILGLKSNGLHTNGYSLARKVLLRKYKVDSYIEELGDTLGNELLKIHISYFKSVFPLIEEKLINGISHITGGGIIGNTKRIVPNPFKIKIDWKAWEVPPIFKLIQKLGKITDAEMRKVFNLGIGLLLIVSPDKLDSAINHFPKGGIYIIGEIV
ncbi:MAG: phosphoribosylformylglycinamidine cyclo-ligase [Ignavibacteria bacterium]|nr:phosphoribosylformylglycinamidine cyclo-ligase [Ignavibacteria bacterium]